MHLHKGSEDLHNCLIVSAASQLANFNIFGERGEEKTENVLQNPSEKVQLLIFHMRRENKSDSGIRGIFQSIRKPRCPH